MALEINEIEIVMRVSDQADEIKPNRPIVPDGGCDNPDHDAIVAECTRRVLQRLANLQAR